MAGLIGIGLTGLKSHQSALNTTGNNVTNTNTPGYSRQEVIFATNPSQFVGWWIPRRRPECGRYSAYQRSVSDRSIPYRHDGI